MEYPVGYKPLHEIEAKIDTGPESWNSQLTAGPSMFDHQTPVGLSAPQHASL